MTLNLNLYTRIRHKYWGMVQSIVSIDWLIEAYRDVFKANIESSNLKLWRGQSLFPVTKKIETIEALLYSLKITVCVYIEDKPATK